MASQLVIWLVRKAQKSNNRTIQVNKNKTKRTQNNPSFKKIKIKKVIKTLELLNDGEVMNKEQHKSRLIRMTTGEGSTGGNHVKAMAPKR